MQPLSKKINMLSYYFFITLLQNAVKIEVSEQKYEINNLKLPGNTTQVKYY